MTFPTHIGTAKFTATNTGTTHVIDLPTTYADGDRFYAMLGWDWLAAGGGNGDDPTNVPVGWTRIFHITRINGTSIELYVHSVTGAQGATATFTTDYNAGVGACTVNVRSFLADDPTPIVLDSSGSPANDWGGPTYDTLSFSWFGGRIVSGTPTFTPPAGDTYVKLGQIQGTDTEKGYVCVGSKSASTTGEGPVDWTHDVGSSFTGHGMTLLIRAEDAVPDQDYIIYNNSGGDGGRYI